MTSPVKPARVTRIAKLLLRLALILALAWGIHLGLNWLTAQVKQVGDGGTSFMFSGMILLILLTYSLVIACPFVPGVEIGFALMAMQGAKIAPFVFLFTVIGLALAFLVGHYLPYSVLSKFLADVGLKRAAKMVSEIQPLTLEQRASLMKSRLPSFLGPLFVNWRYVFLAVLINIPGNMLLGGGGGICFSAGLTRLFRPTWALLTLALAVAPVPAFFYFMGITLF
ncbi:hypothetical protein [Roseobacter sp. N2S]|uniref:hypothetical protein n=1 Tax=Roseobacter sp. N2S TaxID=2663844 RepID=UPI002859EA3B|nr:hypothetical protein [Roseobacter sp. N2S]MDR6265346.1 hypothetical protein [Roseobacter sp. N2S]